MKPIALFFFTAILFLNACKPSGSYPVLQCAIHDSTARRLVKNFADRSHHRPRPILGDTLDGRLPDTLRDTRCVWFSLDRLDSLITQIKKDTVEGRKGIRFYFAAYDKTTRNTDLPTKIEYRCYSTLVMVSTRDSIRRTTTGNDTLHFDYYNNKVPNRIGAILTATPENQGELCPPPLNCFVDGATLLDPEP
jgi:hypothetical protein